MVQSCPSEALWLRRLCLVSTTLAGKHFSTPTRVLPADQRESGDLKPELCSVLQGEVVSHDPGGEGRQLQNRWEHCLRPAGVRKALQLEVLTTFWQKLSNILMIGRDTSSVIRLNTALVLFLNDTLTSAHVFRTFTHNMLAFGLSRKLCNDFLKKQAVIGNLNEGTALMKLTISIKRQTHRLYYIL